MADAMDRVRAAEALYNEVIERTTQLDTRLTTLQASLKSLERETDRAVEVLGNLRRELERRLAVPSR